MKAVELKKIVNKLNPDRMVHFNSYNGVLFLNHSPHSGGKPDRIELDSCTCGSNHEIDIDGDAPYLVSCIEWFKRLIKQKNKRIKGE